MTESYGKAANRRSGMEGGIVSGLRRRLPPLTALVTFESAARLRSFTRAAVELGVTQAAVSRQIQLLEGTLGFPVFRRLHRRIELTDKGQTLAQAASTALTLVADAIAEVSESPAQDELVILASVGFSHFWLLPRISRFSREHPGVKLRIVSQDEFVDLSRGEVDLTIRYGNGLWPDGRSILLFRDDVYPICSSDYLQAHGPIDDLDELVRHPLIMHQSFDPVWTGWEAWLSAFGAEMPRRGAQMVCSSFTDSIYAALAGQGISLGWARLIPDLLEQRRLVRVTSHVARTSDGYHVVLPHRGKPKPVAGLFLDWLSAAAREAEAAVDATGSHS